MSLDRALLAPIVIDPERFDLIVATMAESVVSDVARVISTDAPSIRVPVVTDGTAFLIAESEEIPFSDAAWSEVTCTPQKIATLSAVSIEAIQDTNPAADREIAASIGRAMAARLDSMFVTGGTVSDGAVVQGLATIAATNVNAATEFGPEDFIAALSVAESRGTQIDSWLMSPVTKTGLLTGTVALASSVVGLGGVLQVNPIGTGPAAYLGVPIRTSIHVPAGTIYGIPKERAIVAIRTDATVESDASVMFTSYRVCLRGTMRAGILWTDPAAIARMRLSTVVLPTGATAGAPGAFTPTNAQAATSLANLRAAVTADPTSAWTTGQHVTLGDGSKAHWDGNSWEQGEAV